MFQKSVVILLGIFLFGVVACEPTPAEFEQPTRESAPRFGNIIPYGEAQTREIDTTVETIPNCLGNDHSKLPSRSASSTHSIEWRSGNETGLGLTIGEGVIPGGVNLETAFINTFGGSFTDQFTYTETWALFAHDGMVNTITLLWHEDWQPAYLDVTYATGNTERIELSYRTRIFSTLVKEEETPCDDSVTLSKPNAVLEGETVAELPTLVTAITFTPQPTYTLQPTYTTQSTHTPLPTSTLIPTNTPAPPPTNTPQISSVTAPQSGSCPMIVIEGSVGGLPIKETITWSELAAKGTTSEPQSSNLNEACSRDSDKVQLWVGYWTKDARHLFFYNTKTVAQAISLVNENPNQPAIIVPWGE